MANVLKFEKKVAVVSMLVEGCSINAIVRMTGVHKTTILNLLVDVGDACADLLDANVRDVPPCEVQVDEIWSYVGKKQGHLTPTDREQRPDMGDAYTFVAIDADSKLIVSHLVGKRDGWHANRFMKDVAMRLNGRRVQITSDGFAPYVQAVELGAGLAHGVERRGEGGAGDGQSDGCAEENVDPAGRRGRADRHGLVSCAPITAVATTTATPAAPSRSAAVHERAPEMTTWITDAASAPHATAEAATSAARIMRPPLGAR